MLAMHTVSCHIPAMPDRSSKHLTDRIKLTQLGVKVDKGGQPKNRSANPKNEAAAALGRLGGLKGGHARAASLSAEERSQAAKRAAKARWDAKLKPGTDES